MSRATAESDQMDQIFKSLADSTRRDILRRIVDKEMSVTQIAEPYDLSYAAISKHLKVLEKGNLIDRRREGKSYMIKTNSEPLEKVDDWISYYRKLWNDSFDRLEFMVADMQSQTLSDSKTKEK